MRFDFSKVHVLVVGDVMLDRYVNGEVNRVNPEAPVLVLESDGSPVELAGGAANVACRLRDLGARVTITGVVSTDNHGYRLDKVLKQRGVDVRLVCDDRPTTVKTRYMCGGQQLLRVDHEVTSGLCDEVSDLVTHPLRSARYDALVVSDYAKGVLCPAVLEVVRDIALDTSVVVDPRGSDWKKYGLVSVIKPNARELGASCDPYSAKTCALDRLNSCEADHIITTLGHLGIVVVDEASRCAQWYKAREVEVFDVTGAGDAVAAVLGVSLGAGLGLDDAARLANAAASQVVQHHGVGSIDLDKLFFEVDQTPGGLEL